MRTAGLIALAAAVPQAAARGWTSAPAFSCPSNTNNLCDPDQQQGFDWSKGELEQYRDFSFSSFVVVSNFNNRRDLALRTNKFQDKCIKGSVAKDTPTPPKISCSSGKSFSISEIEVTASKDIDLEFVYGYENGDICKHISPCSKSGSTVKNSQCGGATSVTFKIPDHAEHDNCDVGVHRVTFDCGPPTLPSTPPTSVSVSKPSTSVIHSSSIHSFSQSQTITGNLSSYAATGTAPATGKAPVTLSISSSERSTPASSLASSTLASSEVSTPASVPASSPASGQASSTPASSTEAPTITPPVALLSTASSSPISSLLSSPESSPVSSTPIVATSLSSSKASPPASSSNFTTASSASEAPSTPATSSVPEVTQPIVTTQIVVTTISTCPVTNTVISGTTQVVQSSFTVSTILSTITSTICTKCVAPKPTTSASSAVSIPLSSPATGPGTIATASGTESSGSATSPSVPATIQDVVTTQIVLNTLTTCPVTETITSGSSQSIRITQTVSVIRNTVTSTICTKCVAPPNTQVPSGNLVSEPSSTPNGPLPAPVPSVLPKCMNTWIALTNCENNADSDCYCKDLEFTKNVQDCVSCWSEDSTVIQAALSYLAGICAPAVEANPGIITNVPSTITLCPNPTPTVASSANLLASAGSISPPVPVSIPVTTISLVKTVTIPITFTTGLSLGQAIPSFTTSVISTQVTVPQVKFTTDTLPPGVTGSPEVGLVGGFPASVPAYPTTVGLSTFATGRLSTGAQPTVGPSALAFQGVATRTGSRILGALFVGAVGLLVGL